MNKVELSKKITMHDIYNFISYNLLKSSSKKSIVSIEEIKDILDEISTITNGKDNATNEQILKIIKALLPYKIMNYFDGRIIHNHRNYEKKQIFKYEIIDGQLYIYDDNILQEYKQKIKVEKINGIDVSEIIARLNLNHDINDGQVANILMHEELLSAIGLDVSNEYKLTLLIDENTKKEFSLKEISDNPDFTIFEKEHQLPKILYSSNLENTLSEEYQQKLIYSYDCSQKLLQILFRMSQSTEDIELFNELISKEPDCNIKYHSDEYLDWIYISSFLLSNKAQIKELSDDTYEEIKIKLITQFNCYFLDENNKKVSKISDLNIQNTGYNSQIINNQKIDFKKLVSSIINSLISSSYEIIDQNNIRVYGENLNIMIDKEFIKKILSELIHTANFTNLYPLFYIKDNTKDIYSKPIENETELKEFLQNLSYISKEQIHIKKRDNELNSIIKKFKRNRLFSNLIATKNIIKYDFNNPTLFSYISVNIPEDGKDKEVDIEYVMNEIKKYGDIFYTYRIYHQHQLILEIIREKELSEKGISSKIFNIINTKEKTKDNLVDTIAKNYQIEYINYSSYIQMTLLAYLNSILLYPFNKKYQHQSNDSFIHLRNSLLNGNISFPKGINPYDISNTIIHFKDNDEAIKLSELIHSLNKENNLLSIFTTETTKNSDRKH